MRRKEHSSQLDLAMSTPLCKTGLATAMLSRLTDNFFHCSYDDGGANLLLCLEAQEYYECHSHKTRVKAAGLLTTLEAKKLAGVASVTIAPALLETLAETQEDEAEVSRESIFAEKNLEAADRRKGNLEAKSFLNNETAYREAFASRYGGNGEVKTKQVSLNTLSLRFAEHRVWLTPLKGDCHLQRISN